MTTKKNERIKTLLSVGLKPSRIARIVDCSTDHVFDVSHGADGDYSLSFERGAPMLQEEFAPRYAH